MSSVLKIIHYLVFAIGLGGGIANAIIGARLRMATSDAQAHLGAVQKRIGLLGHVALVLVWLTGVLLVWNLYGGVGELGMLFWFKIAAVGALTVAVLAMDREAGRAGSEGRKPAEGAMAGFGMLATAATVAAIVLAVYAFGG